MVIFVSFIMITSIIGFLSSGSTSSSLRYNDVKFSRGQRTYIASIEGQRMEFDFFPRDIEGVDFEDGLGERLKGKLQLDFTSDANSSFAEDIALAVYNFGINVQGLNVYLRSGFTGNNSFDVAPITCADATASVPVIYFKEGNSTQASAEGECIVITARNSIDIHMMKDRLLYSYLGVMG